MVSQYKGIRRRLKGLSRFDRMFRLESLRETIEYGHGSLKKGVRKDYEFHSKPPYEFSVDCQFSPGLRKSSFGDS